MTDRLTIGYVRDELRNLKAKDKNLTHNDAFYELAKRMGELATPHFVKGPKLSSELAKRIRVSLIAQVRQTFNVISTHSVKCRVAGFENSVSHIDGFYYLKAREHDLTKKADGTKFTEDIVEVRYVRVICDRHKIVLDDISCNISFAHHLLVRLIERGACTKEPVQCVIQGLADFLMLVPLYTLSAQVVGDFGVAMPFRSGLIFGNYVEAKEAWSSGGPRVRAQCNKEGLDVRDIPADNPFAMGQYNYGIRLTTFVSDDLLGWKQIWCRNEILALLRKHKEATKSFTAMLTIPESMEMPSIASEVVPVYDDFKKIVRDPKWSVLSGDH